MLIDGSSHHHSDLPDWYQAKVDRLLGLVEAALGSLLPDERSRKRSARVLWASLHGISAVASVRAVAESPAELVNDLITRYVAGLRSKG
jgi:hypothetical protein